MAIWGGSCAKLLVTSVEDWYLAAVTADVTVVLVLDSLAVVALTAFDDETEAPPPPLDRVCIWSWMMF